MDFKQTTAHVHETGGVFTKKIMQRPRDTSTVFSKPWPMQQMRDTGGVFAKKIMQRPRDISFLQTMANVHDSSRNVFAKTIMQRPRDTRRVFSKAWHMYMMVVVLSLLKPTCKDHMISAQVSVNKPNMHGMWHVLCLRRNKKRQFSANHGPCHRCVTLVESLLKKSWKGNVISWQFSENHGPCHRCVKLVVSLLKKIMQRPRDIMAVFCKPWPMPQMRDTGGVFAKKIMQRPRDIMAVFCKPWPIPQMRDTGGVFAKKIMQRPRDIMAVFCKPWPIPQMRDTGGVFAKKIMQRPRDISFLQTMAQCTW